MCTTPQKLRAVARRPAVVALAILIFVLAVAYHNVIFLGESLAASSNYHPFDARAGSVRHGSFTGNALVNWYDLGGAWWQWEPAAVKFSHALREGRWPVWDPALAGGLDAHVSVVQGQYYPPYLLLLFFGNGTALRDTYYLAQLFITALFCFLLLLRNGCSPFSGATMGVLYALSGCLTQNINSILGQSFAVLPVMIWAADYVLETPVWRRAGIGALVLAVCTLSSFLPIVISGYVLVAIYIVVAIVMRPGGNSVDALRTALRPLAVAVSAIVLSLLLVAFLLSPVQIASQGDPVFASWYERIGLQAFEPDLLLTLVSPSVSYDMLTTDASTRLFRSPYSAGFHYCGIVAITLAFLARSRSYDPRRRRLVLFFRIASAGLLLKLLGVAPFQWLGYVPVLRSVHFVPYFGGALAFAVAGLAAMGVETILRRRSRMDVLVSLVVLVTVVIGILRFAQSAEITPTLTGPVLMGTIAREAIEIARIVLIALAGVVVLVLRSWKLSGRGVALALIATAKDGRRIPTA
ncbi:MAG TPA: hypothetical protein VFL57_12505 [Bryobacteraceae bacterium]|nr:hypothetical protein [Bryobacteraceae bacterium]